MQTESIVETKVYTFAMSMYVYVQVKDVQHPARILADTAEESGVVGTNDFALTIKSGGQQVGKFRGNFVIGWWIQNEV